MRLNLFESGLIDECVAERAEVTINRTGDAKFNFMVLGKEKIEFELWTTKVGLIAYDFLKSKKPDWVHLETENGQLKNLVTKSCCFHIEHCDRGLYSLKMSKGGDSCGGCISTKGYLKTKLLYQNGNNS